MNLLGDLSNITDPLDFKPTKIPKLFELDSLLRCHICKEFLSAPMLTSCGHTFCSVCIRKYLIHTPQCPICAKELRESNLSRNVLLEQVVISYKSVRDDLLKSLKISREISSSKPTEKAYDLDSSRNSIEVLDSEEADCGDDDDGDDVIIIEEPKKRKSEANGIDGLFKKHKPEAEKNGTCPICNKMLPLKVLETTHIDACLANPQPQISQPSTKPSPTQKSDRIPTQSPVPGSPSPYFQPKENNLNLKKLTKLDYSSLSTSALKQRLIKLELPVTGTRNQLENRYNEYLIMWNANCDSVVPKNPKVLRKQLAQWENSLKFKTASNHKQLDGDGWSHLIAQARKTVSKNTKNLDEKKQTADNQEETDYATTGNREESKEPNGLDELKENSKAIENTIQENVTEKVPEVEAVNGSEADTTNEPFFTD